jgi:DNA-binding NarL/FixJ family response regulator
MLGTMLETTTGALMPRATTIAGQSGQPRLLIVDDHPIYRDGLRSVLQGANLVELVGEADDATGGLVLARAPPPNTTPLGTKMGGANGLDSINQLRRICPSTRIVVLSGHHDSTHLNAAMRLGVEGYLPKDMSGPALLDALRTVLAGERVLAPPRAVTSLLNELTGLLRERESERLGLTDQEMEILRLAASGLNNKEIGERQFWSEITVKRKMRRIYIKLDVKTRAQAVAEAIRLGLI